MDIDEVQRQSENEYWTDENCTVEKAARINGKWIQGVLPKGSQAKIAMIDVLYLAVQIKKAICFQVITR